MKKLLLFCVLSTLCLLSCTPKNSISPLKEGKWRGVLTIDDSTGLILPFLFDFSHQNDSAVIVIHNAEENISVTEISTNNDSIFIQMPVFDSEFRCKKMGDTLLIGNWINHARKEKNIIPFTARYGTAKRFDCPEYEKNYPFQGRWKCLFSPGNSDSSNAVGIFKQSAHNATGTFLTEKGDYRYLEGCLFGNYMQLSCFDGAHAFIFHAKLMEEDSTIWGEFYNGLHFHETWIAWKDSSFNLRNQDSLTFLKPGFSKIDFAFPSIENKKVSLADEKFKNKIVILQIMGSWCPNCMDETMFLSNLYKQYKSQGVEIVALAFEKAENFEKAKHNLSRLKNRFNAEYDFLVTGFPPKEADMAFPMLNHIMSFPTTIFIDKKGVVRKIRTGYSGPGTGEEYEKFKNDIHSFMEVLIRE